MKKIGMLVMMMAVLSAAPAFADETTKPAQQGGSKTPCTAVNSDTGAKNVGDNVQVEGQDGKKTDAGKAK